MPMFARKRSRRYLSLRWKRLFTKRTNAAIRAIRSGKFISLDTQHIVTSKSVAELLAEHFVDVLGSSSHGMVFASRYAS